MKYEHIEEKSRWYEYGPGKEFETKDEAIRSLKSKKQEIMTQISLEGLYKLYEGCKIEEVEGYIKGETGAIRLVLIYKKIKSILY